MGRSEVKLLFSILLLLTVDKDQCISLTNDDDATAQLLLFSIDKRIDSNPFRVHLLPMTGLPSPID